MKACLCPVGCISGFIPRFIPGYGDLWLRITPPLCDLVYPKCIWNLVNESLDVCQGQPWQGESQGMEIYGCISITPQGIQPILVQGDDEVGVGGDEGSKWRWNFSVCCWLIEERCEYRNWSLFKNSIYRQCLWKNLVVSVWYGEAEKTSLTTFL